MIFNKITNKAHLIENKKYAIEYTKDGNQTVIDYLEYKRKIKRTDGIKYTFRESDSAYRYIELSAKQIKDIVELNIEV